MPHRCSRYRPPRTIMQPCTPTSHKCHDVIFARDGMLDDFLLTFHGRRAWLHATTCHCISASNKIVRLQLLGHTLPPASTSRRHVDFAVDDSWGFAIHDRPHCQYCQHYRCSAAAATPRRQTGWRLLAFTALADIVARIGWYQVAMFLVAH